MTLRRNGPARSATMTENGTEADQVGGETAHWDDALLFEVAVDPFQQIAASGRDEGRAAGRRDGYLEGANIGRTKGWEIGLELGYIHAFVEGILDGYQEKLGQQQEQQPQPPQPQKSVPQSDGIKTQKPKHRMSHRLERCLTLARDLVNMINEFPDPDALLSQNNGDADGSAKSENRCADTSSDAGCSKSIPQSDSSDCHKNSGERDAAFALNFTGGGRSLNPAAMPDIPTSLERIRGKFKLLCVLLKTKQQFDLKKVLELGTESGNEGGEGNTDNTPAEENDRLVDDTSSNDVFSTRREKSKMLTPGDQDTGCIEGKDSSGLGRDW